MGLDPSYQPRLAGTDLWTKPAAGGATQAIEPLTLSVSVPTPLQLVKPDGEIDAAAQAKPTARDSSGSLDSAMLQINADSRTGSGAADSPRRDSDAGDEEEDSSPTESAQTGTSASVGTAATARAGEAGPKPSTAAQVAGKQKPSAETKADSSSGCAKPATASGGGGGGGLLSSLLCCAGGGASSRRVIVIAPTYQSCILCVCMMPCIAFFLVYALVMSMLEY